MLNRRSVVFAVIVASAIAAAASCGQLTSAVQSDATRLENRMPESGSGAIGVVAVPTSMPS
jgi:hypothetical protein